MKIWAEDCEVSSFTPTSIGFYRNELSMAGFFRTGDCGFGLPSVFRDCEHTGLSFAMGLPCFRLISYKLIIV